MGAVEVQPRSWYVHDENRNNTIRFQCLGATGAVWLFNGQPISRLNATESRIVNKHMIQITTFRFEFAGVYTCRNSLAGKEEANATLQGVYSAVYRDNDQLTFMCHQFSLSLLILDLLERL